MNSTIDPTEVHASSLCSLEFSLQEELKSLKKLMLYA